MPVGNNVSVGEIVSVITDVESGVGVLEGAIGVVLLFEDGGVPLVGN